jgi:GTPase SAR1 family protein
MNTTFYLPKEAAPPIYQRFGGRGAGVQSRAFKEKNFPEWSLKNLTYLLNQVYNDKNRSLLVFGEAGIGKSSVMKQFAKQAAAKEGRGYKNLTDIQGDDRETIIKDPSKYYVFVDLRAGELNPEQAQGIPDVEYGRKTGYLKFLPPDWVKLVSNPNFSGMILLDELNRSDKSILNSLLQLTLDRIVSGHKISDKVMVVAAANMGASFELQSLDNAQLRRFRAGVLVLQPEEWATYARQYGINKYMIDYAMSNPQENLFGRGKEINEDIPINPASLEFASNAMKQVEADYHAHAEKGTPLPEGSSGSIYHDIRVAISGDVGDEYANKFLEWLEIVHAFDWAEIVQKAKAGEFKSTAGKNQFDTSKKFALTRYLTDEVLSRFERARIHKDEAEKKKLSEILGDELHTILQGIDREQLSFVLKSLAHHIKDSPPAGIDAVQAAANWNALITPIAIKAKASDPDFFSNLQKITAEMKKVK